MEENNINNNQKSEVRKHICFENHCWKKCLAMVLASFLGGFLAVYFVASQTMNKQQMQHHIELQNFERDIYNNIEKMHQKELEAFRKAFNINQNIEMQKLSKMSKFLSTMNPIKIKSEFDDNNFKVIVPLKPFQGDESKINYNVQGKKLTVFGNNQYIDNDVEKDISFSQDFILPANSNIAKITKIKDGNKLIISVPMNE